MSRTMDIAEIWAGEVASVFASYALARSTRKPPSIGTRTGGCVCVSFEPNNLRAKRIYQASQVEQKHRASRGGVGGGGVGYHILLFRGDLGSTWGLFGVSGPLHSTVPLRAFMKHGAQPHWRCKKMTLHDGRLMYSTQSGSAGFESNIVFCKD